MKIKNHGTPENPGFIIDDKVIVNNFREEKVNDISEFVYSINYDDQKVSEDEAKDIADKAVQQIIERSVAEAERVLKEGK